MLSVGRQEWIWLVRNLLQQSSKALNGTYPGLAVQKIGWLDKNC